MRVALSTHFCPFFLQRPLPRTGVELQSSYHMRVAQRPFTLEITKNDDVHRQREKPGILSTPSYSFELLKKLNQTKTTAIYVSPNLPRTPVAKAKASWTYPPSAGSEGE